MLSFATETIESPSTWCRSLQFYKNELTLLEDKLVRAMLHPLHASVMPRMEHFQNQFILQKEQLDLLNKEVRKLIKSQHLTSAQIGAELLLKHKMETAEMIFEDTRRDFCRFFAAEGLDA